MSESLRSDFGRKMVILIVSYAYAGTGKEASGGDKIFVEFARRWSRKALVTMFGLVDGLELCRYNGVEGISYRVASLDQSRFKGLLPVLYLAKLIVGIIEAVTFEAPPTPRIAIYSSSDFWPDAIPAFIIKRRIRTSKWVAGLYLFAPNPRGSQKEAEYRGGSARPSIMNFLYYLTQQIAYRMIIRDADFVVVANELDRRRFVQGGLPPERVEPIYGGVDITAIKETPTPIGPRYDGCFIGRLHPQKGPLQLVRIWKQVCNARPGARLALIGEGPLERQVKLEIVKAGLSNNVSMLGWVEGKRKYEILKSSRVFLHTPILDTGGMAAAEGMACGLPVVAFDLPGYRYTYPHGMVRVAKGDLKAFASKVLQLLTDRAFYEGASREASSAAMEWDWNSRSERILSKIDSLFS